MSLLSDFIARLTKPWRDERALEDRIAASAMASELGQHSPAAPLPMRERPTTCPMCGHSPIAEYFFGMPPMDSQGKIEPEIRARITAGQIELGGCITTEHNPDWHCQNCKTDFIQLREACDK